MTAPAWQAPTPLRPDEERTWAVLVHVVPLLGPGFLAPLVVWLVFRGRGPFLEHHAKESLNVQLTLLVASVALGVLSVLTLGFAAFLFLPLYGVWLVAAIVAALAAGRWEWFRTPGIIRFVR